MGNENKKIEKKMRENYENDIKKYTDLIKKYESEIDDIRNDNTLDEERKKEKIKEYRDLINECKKTIEKLNENFIKELRNSKTEKGENIVEPSPEFDSLGGEEASDIFAEASKLFEEAQGTATQKDSVSSEEAGINPKKSRLRINMGEKGPTKTEKGENIEHSPEFDSLGGEEARNLFKEAEETKINPEKSRLRINMGEKGPTKTEKGENIVEPSPEFDSLGGEEARNLFKEAEETKINPKKSRLRINMGEKGPTKTEKGENIVEPSPEFDSLEGEKARNLFEEAQSTGTQEDFVSLPEDELDKFFKEPEDFFRRPDDLDETPQGFYNPKDLEKEEIKENPGGSDTPENSENQDQEQDNKKYTIRIGSSGIVISKGLKVKINPDLYKIGAELNVSFYNTENLDIDKFTEKLKKNYSEETINLIKDCYENGVSIDFTVINTINKIGIESIDSNSLINGYLTNLLKARYEIFRLKEPKISENLKKYKDAKTNENIEIIYDMKDLSRLPFLKVLFSIHPEKTLLTGEEKGVISLLADAAGAFNIGKTEGEYKYDDKSFFAKILSRFKSKSAEKLLPKPGKMKTLVPGSSPNPNIRYSEGFHVDTPMPLSNPSKKREDDNEHQITDPGDAEQDV